jgi:hypothetical protein
MEGEHMRQMDTWMLWGAWALMAAVGSVSAWKISQTPKVDPGMVSIAKELTPDPRIRRMEAPPPAPIPKDPGEIFPPTKPVTPWAGHLRTAYIGVAVNPPPTEVFILQLAKISPEAKADLNGVSIGWELFPPTVRLETWMIRKDAAPEKIVVLRQCEDAPPETVAELGPKARSFTDLSTEPRLTYRYWVTVTGKETDLAHRPLELKTVTKELPRSAEARTPAITRLKLVGGSPSLATLKVEIYDRAQKKWILKIVQAAPGRDIGKSGWILKGLHLDKFTLVADVTDDEGVDRVLRTTD